MPAGDPADLSRRAVPGGLFVSRSPFRCHLCPVRRGGGALSLDRSRAGRGRAPLMGSLVDSASSHMLVSKIKPCMSKYKQLYRETANGSLNQLSFI